MFNDATRNEFLMEFLSENREALNQIEQGVLRLESTPGDAELINTIFRNMHTVKGNCRMMEFSRLEELTHEAESLLDHLRENRVTADQALCSLLLQVLDQVRITLDWIAQRGEEGETEFAPLIAAIQKANARAEEDYIFGLGARAAPPAGAEGEEEGEEEVQTSPPAGPAAGLDLDMRPETVGGGDAQTARLDSIKLSIERLDTLMDLAGEMGAAFNQLRYTYRRDPSQALNTMEILEQLIHQLQDEVLQYRLQPIGRIWDSYHRLVRDLAVATGKKVLLELSGEETEVDRTILLSLKEALGHMIRNAVDHGIEAPQERVAAGKSPIGRIRLQAEQKHGQICLEMTDDGQGIPVARVRDKAIQRGIVTESRAQEMSEEEVLRLVMEPGFSTAEQVSRLSGRGTGMDVVKTSVEKVGGSIQILSQRGSGTRFLLRIPQTVSIVPTLLVRAGGMGYAIPQANVVEMVSCYGPEVAGKVEGKLHQPMLRVRDRLLPLLLLDRVLSEGEVPPSTDLVGRTRRLPELHAAILQTEEKLFALAVEAIEEPMSLVVKPLPRALSYLTIFAGSAIMPDGSVSFLLNVPEFHRHLTG